MIEEAENPELQSNANCENTQNSIIETAQTDVDNLGLHISNESGTINNNQNIIEDKNNVDRRTNAPSVREIREKYFKKADNNDKRNIRETVEAFTERTRRVGDKSGGKKRILLVKGKLAIAVAPSYSIP